MLKKWISLVVGVGVWIPHVCGWSVEESFLAIDGKTGQTLCELGSQIDQRMSPCSTFKMTLSLMGYDAGILQDETTPTWDFHEGYDDWLEAWRAPQTPQSWMNFSCVWYSKSLAVALGLKKIQRYLEAFQYGNRDISGGLGQPGEAEVAWINSSLKISPREQVAWIQKMLQKKLPVSDKARQMTCRLVFKERMPEGWELFGKTGWSGSDITRDGRKQHAWFVGWVEHDHRFFPFAYLIRDHQIDLGARIPRVKQLLIESGMMKAQ